VGFGNQLSFVMHAFVLVSKCHEWSAGAHMLLLYAVVHAATFAVNDALVMSQCQHRAWTFPCTPPLTLSTRLDRTQVWLF